MQYRRSIAAIVGDAQMPSRNSEGFFGWRVTWAAFVVATFGWGVGFYGPPVFMHSLEVSRGWSISLLSAAVTLHFLLGALVVAALPAIYRRFGVPATTKFCALGLAVGILGWAVAQEPWQLFAATIFSGFGWAGTGAFAINTMVSPWFERRRPAALSIAYNGASLGGILFSPLWVALIAVIGFPASALVVGAVMVTVLWLLSNRYFSLLPKDLGTGPDGEAAQVTGEREGDLEASVLPGRRLWTSRAFLTYTAGFSIGLFVQVGIISHLVSLLGPSLGAFGAGAAASLATLSAVVGRSLVGWFLPPRSDRRLVAAATYALQACGCGAFILADGQDLPLLFAGVVLFGLGIGNVTSLPPLIAQAEFARADVARAIAIATAVAQAAYAFAPAVFGGLRGLASGDVPGYSGGQLIFVVAAAGQLVAALTYLTGRVRHAEQRRAT
jgi:MFS family permease